MENPFCHNRAINIIGRILDDDREQKAKEAAGEPMLIGGSLEARIGHALEAAGLLNDKAKQIVGLAGRFGHPEVPEEKPCDACAKSERREWTEPEEHTCGIQNG